MKIISVNTSTRYDVIIGNNLFRNLPTYLKTAAPAQKTVVISDGNVWSLYGKILEDQLVFCGYDVCHYVIEPGEESKSADAYLKIVNYLASERVTRSDILLAFGGGVVGDLTGFVAATYLRGISYIQIPTTVLAMVDSSVGGKTAINLPSGKNLVGAFYQPKLVLCDISLLATLPDDIFCDGCSEIIKYGILYDPALFQHLSECGLSFDREYVISRCIALKRNVVESDEFDCGQRQHLNLGHTVGHAVETLSRFQISHGNAVAIGMNVIAKVSYYMGLCGLDVATNIHRILQRFGFALDVPFGASEVYQQILSDKKRAGKHLNLIMPIEIGKCQICKTPIEELQSILETGLSPWTF